MTFETLEINANEPQKRLTERDIAAGQSHVSLLISQSHEHIVTADLVAVSGSLADVLS